MGHGTVSPLPFARQGLKAIVFDLDGTLYQDDRLGEQVNRSAIRYVASLRDLPEAQAEALLVKTRGEIGDGGTLSRSVVALGGNLVEMHARFSREVHPEGILERDERVPELLRRLATRFALHLYTNNNRELSGRIMERIGVTGLFQRIFTIQDYWLPKPDPKIIIDILEQTGVKPAEALFVGDRYQVDLAAPESIGCPVFESKTVDELLTLSQLLD